MTEKPEPKRTANFTSQEISILLEIIKQYKHIIECKQSDKVLWSKKIQTWGKIEELFNAKSGIIYRDATVLKKKYDNLKKVAKKKYADEKCAIRGTGGGPAVPSLITPIDEEIKELIGVQIDGCEAIYDSDKVLQVSDSCEIVLAASSNNGDNICLPNSLDTTGAKCSNTGTDSCVSGNPNNNWSRYVPAMLRQPLSNELQFVVIDDGDDEANNSSAALATSGTITSPGEKKINIKVPTKKRPGKGLNSEKWERLAEAKLEHVHLKSSLALKEHESKERRLTEKQERMRKSYQQKLQQNEEEHNLRIQKLKYEIELLKQNNL